MMLNYDQLIEREKSLGDRSGVFINEISDHWRGGDHFDSFHKLLCDFQRIYSALARTPETTFTEGSVVGAVAYGAFYHGWHQGVRATCETLGIEYDLLCEDLAEAQSRGDRLDLASLPRKQP